MRVRHRFLGAVAAIAAMTAGAAAQTWPERPIKLIVPFPAGGPTDIIARVVTQSMGETLGQPIIVENRGGAGGVTGVDAVSRSAPDGYTFGLGSAGALAILPSLQKMPYRPTVDLAPLTLVAKVPELLVVPASSSAKTLDEFIAMAKAKPGSLNFASTGIGGTPHLAAELLKSVAKIDVVHVPYSGAAPAVTDLLPGRVQMMFADIPVLLPHVLAGVLRPLAIGSAKRSPILPDVATFPELGLPGVEAENWYGFVIPAAAPAAVQAKLQAASVKALRSPEVLKTLGALGVELPGNTPDEFKAYILGESAKWAEVVRISGAKIE